jgi:hypothetical protein
MDSGVAMDPVRQLIKIAEQLARETPGFLQIKGPGSGDRATSAFMQQLRQRVDSEVPEAEAEQRISGRNSLAVDFYLPKRGVVVEVALGLRNPTSEFEKDILKALMAQEAGHSIRRLVFISKPGARKRHQQPGVKAIVQWAKRRHGLTIELHELGGAI